MSQKTILVVDDSAIDCAFLEEVLGEAGYEVDTASTGEEALEKVRAKEYNLIFIDHALPCMDGVQLCEKIKKLSPKSVPLYMTGKIRGEDLVRGEVAFSQAGGKVYQLYKPFSSEEILEAARKALQ